ncbi:hypothetical protein HYU22_05195 [Candidatus Woesearchaeota archaeon]|nr:hypothetical protein [Candidatus Woesearchaeota archaeon]
MLSEISQHLREKFKLFFLTDNLIVNNKFIPVTTDHFVEIAPVAAENTIAFVDGGQAEILSGGNINLSFIRVFAQVMKYNKKISSFTEEFYILTSAVYRLGDIWYEGKVFSAGKNLLIDETDLMISSTDASIRSGNERAPISRN